MDVTILVLGSVFLIIFFVINIFLMSFVLTKVKSYFDRTDEKVMKLSGEVHALNESYKKDVKDILKNQTDLLKILKL